MKRLQKMLSALLITLLLFTTVSCSGGDAVSGTIEWWVLPVFNDKNEENFISDVAAAFLTEHPNATINITILDPATAEAKLKDAATSGKEPDVFFGDLALLEKTVDTSKLLDLSTITSDLTKAKESLPDEKLLTLGTSGESLFFYPIVVQPYLMAFNKDILSTAGVLEELPSTEDRSWTTEEYTAFLEKLRAALPSTQDVGIFYYGSTAGTIGTKALTLNAYGASLDAVDSEEMKKGFTFLEGLMKNNDLATDSITIAQDNAQPNYLVNGFAITAEESLDLFQNGTSAHTIFYSLDLDVSGAKKDNFSTVFMPYPRSGNGGGLPFELLGAAAFDKKDSKKTETSKAFIDFLANDENYRAQVCGYAGGISSNPSYNTFLEGEYAFFSQTLALLGDYHAYGYEDHEANLRWTTLLRRILLNGMDMEEAISLYSTEDLSQNGSPDALANE